MKKIFSLILMVLLLAVFSLNMACDTPAPPNDDGGGNENPPQEYSITYNLNGGVVDGENPLVYTTESEDITLVNPKKDGCTFIGWTGTGLSELTLIVVIESGSTGDREYAAHWQLTDPDLPVIPT